MCIITLLTVPQLSLASCIPDPDESNAPCNDKSSSSQYTDKANTVALLSIIGLGAWYFLSDDEQALNSDAQEKLVASSYKLQLAPVSDNRSDGLQLKLSYRF